MNVLDILNSPWAIAPEKLNEICAIYAAHRNGETRDLQAIEKLLEAKASTVVAIGAGDPMGDQNYTVQDGIALIPIEGVLSKRMSLFQQICGGMSYTSLQRDLAQALSDPSVKGIITTIDSPGGAVDGVQAAADAIYAARSQKPIVAHVDGMCASAAYWLGSAAAEIYIGSDTDQVGSIGVITQHIDTSNAEHQRGVKITDIAAGRYKTVGSQHAPLSAQDRSSIQDHLDHLYGIFVDTVAKNRGTDAKTVLSQMADGRVFVGQKAIDAGLVDGKITLPALIAKLRNQKTNLASRSGSQRFNYATPGHGNPDGKSSSMATPSSSDERAPQPNISPIGVEVSKPSQPPLTEAELKIRKLRPLKLEEIRKRRLLDDALKAGTTAAIAIHQAQRSRKTVAEIEPYVTAQMRAEQTQRELRSQLRSNEEEQLAILRG